MTGFTLTFENEAIARKEALAYFDHWVAEMPGTSLTITFGANAVIVSFWTEKDGMYRNDRFEF